VSADSQAAGTRPGWYTLERRDGAPEHHYRAEIANLDDVIRALIGFLQDDPTIPRGRPIY
jgi:hypothetical protein